MVSPSFMKTFGTDPESACYLIWTLWFVSWWSAAQWSSRTASGAGMVEQLPYRLITLVGFVLLFGSRGGRFHGPWRFWILPNEAGWVMTGLCVVGFVFAWWARLHLGKLWSAFVTRKADHHIVDTGPYGMVRHPIYTGLILSALAVAVIKGSVYAIAGFGLATLGFWMKARMEERFLRNELGAEAYDSYRRRVPMLIPLSPA
jgi:protein-S-isoprenylcysteine O-methyltransferase Ste14